MDIIRLHVPTWNLLDLPLFYRSAFFKKLSVCQVCHWVS